jgi:hypothetical protein
MLNNPDYTKININAREKKDKVSYITLLWSEVPVVI